MDDDLKAAVERVERWIGNGMPDQSDDTPRKQALTRDLRTLLSALHQRDEALRRARRYVADLPIVGDEDLALIDAILTGSETK